MRNHSNNYTEKNFYFMIISLVLYYIPLNWRSSIKPINIIQSFLKDQLWDIVETYSTLMVITNNMSVVSPEK